MGLAQKYLEVAKRAIGRVDVTKIRDVIAIIFPRRRIERQQPNRGDAQIFQVVELFGKAAEITYSVAVLIEKCSDVKFINNGIFVPKRVVFKPAQNLRMFHPA